MLKLIYEQSSVTRTARILGVTQSTISHSLDRMRGLLGDPLFIKTGRAMVPTARMEAMIGEIDEVLSGLEALSSHSGFDPAHSRARFSIACNDLEHTLLMPDLFAKLRQKAPFCSLRTYTLPDIGSDCMADHDLDLWIHPFPPANADDLVIHPLYRDSFVTFYDPAIREAPKDLADFANSPHAILASGEDEKTDVDHALARLGLSRNVVYVGPSFAAVAMVMAGTNILTTAASRLSYSSFSGFASMATLFELEDMAFYMIWHIRNRYSARHQWFRELVKSVASNADRPSHKRKQV